MQKFLKLSSQKIKVIHEINHKYFLHLEEKTELNLFLKK